MWNNIIAAVSKLPIAKWIKPWWKAGLKAAVLSGGDRLQAEADAALQKEAEKALPKIQAKVDGLQARFNTIVDGLPFPVAIEEQIKAAVNEPVDRLQERMTQGCASGCAHAAQEAFDQAFDKFQVELAAKIDAL